jgi:hypothetical protein
MQAPARLSKSFFTPPNRVMCLRAHGFRSVEGGRKWHFDAPSRPFAAPFGGLSGTIAVRLPGRVMLSGQSRLHQTNRPTGTEDGLHSC